MGLGHGIRQGAESGSESACGAKIMMRLTLVLLSVMMLSACGDKDQPQAASTSSKFDGKPWQDTKNPYVVKGWSPGDKASWEGQLRTRAQVQNEYVKVN